MPATNTAVTTRAMPATHDHAALTTREIGFTGPAGTQYNPSAHGNRTRVDTCACGMSRETNFNGRHEEVGSWHFMARQADPHAAFAGLSQVVKHADAGGVIVVNPTVQSAPWPR